MKKPPLIHKNVKIIGFAAEGKAIAKVNEKVVFVPLVAPGDVVDIRITAIKKNYMEGRAIEFHSYSNDRVEPFCRHYGLCGGCKWQHIPYEKQLEYKQQQVEDCLTRIGKIDLPEINAIVRSESQKYYRNKLEFTFSNYRWLTREETNEDKTANRNGLGFHLPGKYDRILNIDSCYLQAEPSNSIRNFAKKYAIENELEFFNLKSKVGFLRNVIIRNTNKGDLMVIVVFFREQEGERVKMLEAIKNKFPEITSLYYIINTKRNDSLADQQPVHFSGETYIYEKMEDLEFRVGPKSFFQTNSEQALRLYQIARDYAQISEKDVVYDLYTGTGTIANFIAKKAGKVVGIEFIAEAIEDAWKNADINKIQNVHFEAGDMVKVLNEDFISNHGKPNIIITDPPRAGMHKDVVKQIISTSPQRIVYISCNPATQARDLELMKENYRVEKVQPVDMFPHTHHVENVVLLKRIGS